MRFTDVTDTAGVHHQFQVFEGLFGGGACVIDFDQDGFEDVYVTGGLNDDQLLRNNGDGTLTDVLEGSGLELTRRFVTQGVVAADVNRDGYRDLFITTITSRDSLQIIPRARNLLFLGQADHTFRDATDAYGLTPLYSFSTGGSFGDFNQDGWPDLFVGNYFQEYDGHLSEINDATIVNANRTAHPYLLRNEEGSRFTNVAEAYGLTFRGFGFGGVFTDFDNDGDQDLFVNHDFGYKATPNFLMRNDFPDASFTDVSEERDMDLRINAMSAAVGDYNADGLLDYFVTNIKFNRFMVAQGEGLAYDNRMKELGMNYVSISWGANFADFDQDGDLDLFVANGDLNPNCVPMANFYFDNDGRSFTERGREVGLGDYGIGRGSVTFDLENDGDLDLLVVCQNAVLEGYPVASTTRLFRNDGDKGHWLQVVLRGTSSDLNGLGARVTVFSRGRKMIREVDGGGSSHLSQSTPRLHFGLGDAERADSVLVTWPGGHEQLLTDQAADRVLEITEPVRPVGGGSSRWWWIGAVVGVALLLSVFFVQRR
ncbi:CRTAC1 family protein [Lewinella sp. JB7]|uniref:CRTAC1 family protein n=1 Tax=Lewinella sp. JB7 TaxID=2962887 RepID=UPI0020CA0DED|nr:CRTAC1 family protein [Lewinella sp. JB7]MCP9235211.1 CRTAC1 family protein [Lewinella sp. JB7]